MYTYRLSNGNVQFPSLCSVLHFCPALQVGYQLLHGVVLRIGGSVHQSIHSIGVYACSLGHRADVSVCQHGLDLFECHGFSLDVKKIAWGVYIVPKCV